MSVFAMSGPIMERIWSISVAFILTGAEWGTFSYRDSVPAAARRWPGNPDGDCVNFAISRSRDLLHSGL